MAERTVSQRANDLFAAFVRVLDEQNSTPAGSNSSDEAALSDRAFATRDALMAECDRTGNADMIAARLLAGLMWRLPWPLAPRDLWDEHDADALRILEAVADRTTGLVRERARVALQAVGLEIAEEAADAMLDLCERERRYRAAYATAPFETREEERAWEKANDVEAGTRLCADPPPISTEAGLRAAIRYVAEDEGFIQKPHARILARALQYLDGRGTA